MARMVCEPSTWTRSTAPIIPPAAPIALATCPSIPGLCAISTRSVMLYCALGVPGIARDSLTYRCNLPTGPDARRTLPDRRQQLGLPGVLRAARVDRHLHGRSHERDLRVRVDAGEDPDRLRPQGHRGHLGRGGHRPPRAVRRVQGAADHSPGPAQGAMA